MGRPPVTPEQGEMLMRLALSVMDELSDEQLKRAVERWSQQPELDDAEFRAFLARVNRARKELGLQD